MEQHLSQYKIFYEVARAGNISKAAKELYISQPAISKSISKLEDSLGVPLFNRNSRGVSLTEEGRMLFQHVQAAFDALGRGELELKRIKEFNIGQLRIGVSNTLCRYVLLPYLKLFINYYPHIKVTIECQSSTHTLSMLEQQHIDLGLVAEPLNKKHLTFQPLMDIEDVFVTTQSYLDNLYLREGRSTDVFQSGNLILLDRTNLTRHYVDDYFESQGIEPQQVLEVTSMDLLIEFVKIGLGIGCVIREFVKEDLASGKLIEVPLNNPILKRTVGIAYNPSYKTHTLESFLEFVQ